MQPQLHADAPSGAPPPPDAPADNSWFTWLAQMSPALVWVTDADHRVRYANPAFRNFLGLPPDSEVRMDWRSLIHPEDYDIYTNDFRQAAALRRPFSGGAKVRDASGEWRHFTTRASPYFLDGGEFGGYIGLSTDVSDRARAVAALEDSERKYRTLFESIDQGFCVVEVKLGASGQAEDYRFVEVNPAFEGVTGITGAVGRWMREIAPAHEETWFEMYGRVALTGEPVQFTSHAEALGRWYEVYAYRVGRPEERLVGILFDDITGRMQQEQRRLREADTRKDEFIATLAHELRNPLAPIRNAIELIKHPRVSLEQARSTATMMERQITHLVRLVDDLMDVSRVSRGKLELRMERMDLVACVDEAVEMCAPRLAAGGHTVRRELPGTPVELLADRVRITQVLVNVVTNASKYSPDGTDIRVCVAVQDGQAVVRVVDEGMGIAPEMLPRIFDMFTQADLGDAPREGLGIGLTLVKLLVEMHGGTVGAHSEGLGHGSEVFFALPLVPAAGAPSRPG